MHKVWVEKEWDKCSIQRDRLRTFQNSERHQPTDSEFQQTWGEINTQKTTEDWKWRDKTWINNIKNEKGDIITDPIGIKNLPRYYK